MRKYIFLLFVATMLFACTSGSKNAEKTLTVTIAPQHYFLKKLAGDVYKINTLVPPSTSPETYEPSPATMIELGKSTAYFKVGFLGFENAWSEKLAQNNPNVKIVDCSEGIELMEDEHGHGHSHGDGHDHAHTHNSDPHIWTSPKNALNMAENMLAALLEIDPENENIYRENFKSLSEEILKTDEIIKKKLENIPSRSFIIYHPALGYFARDYGLTQYSIEFEGKSPSPAQLKETIDLARKDNIKSVFILQGFDSKNAEVVAHEIGAKVITINPLSEEWADELIRLADILAKNE